MINMKHAYSSNTYTLLHFERHFDPSVFYSKPPLKRTKSKHQSYSKPPLKRTKSKHQSYSKPSVKKEKDVLNITIKKNSSFSNLFILSGTN